MNKTFMANNQTVQHNWYVVDAAGLTLGRLSTVVASLLRGKHKPTYTPHVDCGDNIVIINAQKVTLTGNELEDKMYYDHSMYQGGLRERTAKVMKEEYPVEMMERAVKGMLPHNRLGRQMAKKLFVYAGNEHKHMAQKPEVLEMK